MAITAADVKKLRDQTGAGMMDAKRALTEAEGDFDKAVELLRIAGQAKVSKRSDRDAANGMVASCGKTVVQLGAETDFVAKNDEFVALAKDIADAVSAAGAVDVASGLAVVLPSGQSVAEAVADLSGKTGEKLELSNVATFDGEVDVYLHRRSQDLPPQIGIMIEFEGTDRAFVRSLCYQIAAMSPIYLTAADVPVEVQDNERHIARATALEEGKPEHIIDKIVEGKLKAYFKEACLLEQVALEDEKKTVGQLCQAAGVTVKRFVRFATGD